MLKKSTLLFFISIIIVTNIFSQTFSQNTIAKKGREKNFFEIQKSFYERWKPYHVVNGYYFENGERKKAAGWKQFKRWEWYWEYRVNPKTGEFPDTTAGDLFSLKQCKTYGVMSSDGNWTSYGPNSSVGGYEGIGRINCVAFHPSDNNKWWVGSPSGGLWYTSDNGTTWSVLTDNNEVLGVSDIAVLPDFATSNTMYIGTGDRDGGALWNLGGGQHNDNNSIGLLKSTDGGNTWSETGMTFHKFEYVSINRILVNPQNTNSIKVANSYGIAVSYDAAVSWSYKKYDNVIDMEYKPGDTSVIYASTNNYWGAPVIYRSTDGGESWNTVKTFASTDRRVEIAVTADDANYLYAVVCKNDNSLNGVYKSTDGGSSFTLVYDGTTTNHNLLGWKTDGSSSGGQGSYDLALEVSSSDKNTVYLGGVNTFKSTDGGVTWTAVSCWTSSTTYNKNNAPVVHADHHVLKIRSSDGTLFDGNDGGIYYTSDEGTSWSDKTNGIVISQMYRVGVSQTVGNEIICGLQDNGTKLLSGGTWDDVKGGDGMECIIDFTDVNTQYAATPNGDIARTTDHWTNSTRITQDYTGSPINGLTETGAWVTPYVVNPQNHNTLFIGLQNVWKSVDKGNTWTKISSINYSDKLREIAIAPSDTSTIYVAGKDSIWKTNDGGSTWTNITGTLTQNGNYITYISVKNNDPSTLWVSLGQYDSYGVFQSTDGGSTWQNISTGLPYVPVMCVIQNRQNTSYTELYAATDVGVYAKRGEGNWFAFSSGLPNVVVTELEIYYDDANNTNSKLRAATYGRGLWESDLFSEPSSVPVVAFEADDTIPEIGQTVKFTDESTNAPTSWQWSFSPNTVTYVNGTSNTSVNPEVTFDAIGVYTVTLTATNGAGNGSLTKTNYIDVGYCEANGWEGDDSYIKDVELMDIDNENTGSDGYKNYTNLSTELHLGYTYFLTVHNGNTNSPDDDLGVWVDWNEDGDFDDSDENIVCSINSGANNIYSFQVPSGTSYGSKRMRIRIKTAGSNCGSACGDAYEGEVEDYTVVVTRETNEWTGDQDNDWDNSSNWQLGSVPDINQNVLIPTSPSGGVFPEIKTGAKAKCYKLTLEQGATITINGTLNVAVDN